MPNHCMNELIFRDVDEKRRDEILAAICNADGNVDFQILVPIPVNVWQGPTGTQHEKAFGKSRCWFDWCSENWGTKWNAYDHAPIESDDTSLTIRFQTAWTPPYPWLAAIFNTLQCRFEHNWISEGGARGVSGLFDWAEREKPFGGEAWKEADADEPMQRHLHKLLWGVEAFDDEEA